jgi:hypothetical protein
LNAAIIVADLETNLYTSDVLITLNVYSGIGKGIREFIAQFINPSLPAATVPAATVPAAVSTVTLEDDDVTKAIKSVCISKKVSFTPELIGEFNTWQTTIDKKTYCKYSSDRKLIPWSPFKLAEYWARYYSTTLNKLYRDAANLKHINKFCIEYNIPYNNDMITQFNEWYSNPSNNKYITSVYSWSGKKHTSERSPYICVKNWFKTITHVVLNK